MLLWRLVKMAWEARLGLKQSRNLPMTSTSGLVKMAWEARLGLKLLVGLLPTRNANQVKMAWEARLGLKLLHQKSFRETPGESKWPGKPVWD